MNNKIKTIVAFIPALLSALLCYLAFNTQFGQELWLFKGLTIFIVCTLITTFMYIKTKKNLILLFILIEIICILAFSSPVLLV